VPATSSAARGTGAEGALRTAASLAVRLLLTLGDLPVLLGARCCLALQLRVMSLL
jgi:hypothetical protein